MFPRDRGKGQYFSNYRGRGGRGGRGGRSYSSTDFPIIQQGNKKLINENISGIKQLEDNPELFEKVQEYLKSKNNNEASSSSANKAQSSYAEIIISGEKEEDNMIPSPYKEIIISLEFADLKWQNEPWKIMQKYLSTASYAAPAYKRRKLYEEILIRMGACEFRHFKPYNEAKTYNFSRVIIRQIITAEEWGLGTLNERQCQITNDNGGKEIINFNYWDIKEAYYKIFFYQNPLRKHSWWIKICPKVYSQGLPTWLYDWWQIFGTSEKILPEEFKSLFYKWKDESPALIEARNQNRYIHNMDTLHYFAEFGIPWIWKWEPELGYDYNNVPCLKRKFSTKFWNKMMEKETDGNIQGIQTLSLIKEKIQFYTERNRVNKPSFVKEQISPFEEYLRKNISQMNRKELVAKFLAEIKNDISEKLGEDVDQLTQEEEEEENVDITSTEPMDDSNRFGLLQDAQDPYEDEEIADPNDTYNTFIRLMEGTKSSKASTSSSKKDKMSEE